MEAWQTAIMATMPAGVLAVDAREHITFVNRSGARILGRGERECLGWPVRDVLPLPNPLTHVARAPGEPFESRYDLTLRSGRGEEVTIGLTVVPFPPGELPAGSYVCIFRSLGELRRVDLEMRHLERLAAMGQLVAGFAHEVRNPLAALKSLLEDVIQESPAGDPRSEHYMRMERLIRRMQHMVTSTLQFARPASPKHRAQPVRALIHSALEGLDPRLWRCQPTRPSVSLPEEELVVYADPEQLVEALVILLTNALEATGDARRVHLRARVAGSSDSRIIIDVEDEGPGISQAQLQQIFAPFFTTKDRGTGLGLPIALKLIQENEGQLTVESTPGVRTLFSVDVPRGVS